MFQTKNNKELGSASKDDDFEDMIGWGSPLSNSSNLSQDSANVSSTLDFLDDEDECMNSQEDKKINFSFVHKTKEEAKQENSVGGINEDRDLNIKEARYNSQSLFDSDEDNAFVQGVETQIHNRHEENNNIAPSGIKETSHGSIEHTHVSNREELEEIHASPKTKMDEKSHFWPQKSSLIDSFSQSSDENDLPFKDQTALEKVQNHHEPRVTGLSNELQSSREIDEKNKLGSFAYDRSKSVENIKEKNIQAVYASSSQGSSLSTDDLNFSYLTSNSVKPDRNSLNMPLEEGTARNKISLEGSETGLFEDNTSQVDIGQNFHSLDGGSFPEHDFQKAFESSSVFKVLLIDDFSDLGVLDFLGISDESVFDSNIDAKIDGDLLNKALSEGHSFSDSLLSSLILPDSISGNLIKYKLGYLPAEDLYFKPSNLYQVLETHDKNLFKAFFASQEDKILFFAIFYKMGLLGYEDCRGELDLNNPYHHHVLCKLGILHEGVNEEDEILPANRNDVKEDMHFDNQKDFEPDNKEYIEPQDIHENTPNEMAGDFIIGNHDRLDAYSNNRSRPLFEDSDDSSDLFPGIDNSLDGDAKSASHKTENNHLMKNSDESLSSNDKELRDNYIQATGSVESKAKDIGEGLSSLSIKPSRTVSPETDDTSSLSTNLETDDGEPSYSLIANVGSNENKELVATDEDEISSTKNTTCQHEKPNDENLMRDLPESDNKADECHYETGGSLDHPSEEYLDKGRDSSIPEDNYPDKPIYNNDSNSKSSSDLKSDVPPFYKNKFSKSFADIFTLEGEASDKISTDVSSFIADATENDKPLLALSEAEERSSVISSILGIFKKKPAEPSQSKDDPYLNRYSRPKTAELKVPDKERKIVQTPYANKKQAGSFEIPGFKKANK